jgi:hypothetical protein
MLRLSTNLANLLTFSFAQSIVYTIIEIMLQYRTELANLLLQIYM